MLRGRFQPWNRGVPGREGLVKQSGDDLAVLWRSNLWSAVCSRLLLLFELECNSHGEKGGRPVANEDAPTVRLGFGMTLLASADQPGDQRKRYGGKTACVRVLALDACVVQLLNHGNSFP